MKKIYISLPINSMIDSVEERNEEACNWVVSHIEGRYPGYEEVQCVSPIDINSLEPDNLSEARDWQKYMGKDIEALLRCDAILMCNGWQNNSKGCMCEFETARIYEKDIFMMY